MSRAPLVPVAADEARRRLAVAAAGVRLRTERVPLAEALGRVLAAPIIAHEPLPAFARALMDGWAVRAADVARASAASPASLQIVGAVEMGAPAALGIGPGEAIAVATGAHLPEGADAVVMVEQTRQVGRQVAILAPVVAGRNLVRAGEDVAAGQVVLVAGQRLRAQHLAALAAFGATSVEVYARPRVAILSTGSELCAPDEAPPLGKVRDVNQTTLAALASGEGAHVTRGGVVPDDPTAIEGALEALAAAHDLVLLSGGSSIGGKDFTGEIFARLPRSELLFHGIACRPGRPTIAARLGGAADHPDGVPMTERLLVGLPGVPAAAVIIFEIFVRPALRRIAGAAPASAWIDGLPARFAAAHESALGREDYLRVRLEARDEALWAIPLGGGPAALSGLVAAEALVVVPASVERLGPGDCVTVRPIA